MYKPVKLPRNRQYGSNYWEGKSVRYNRMVSSYSTLEFDNWILTETDPNIIDYCEQPDVKIEYIRAGKLHQSIIDMWSKHRIHGEEFTEVKYTNELKPGHKNYERNLRQIEIQQNWCNDRGIRHVVKTEEHIRANRILLDNKKHILSFVRNITPKTLEYSESFLKALSKAPTNFFKICVQLPELSTYHIHELSFWHLYHGNVEGNIDTVMIGNETEIWLCPEEN